MQPPGKPANNGGFWLTGTGARPAIFPDDILLLIGSNANDGGTPAPVIEQRLELMLTKIFTLRPNTHVFLATIPPLPVPTDSGKTAIAKEYNRLMKAQTVPKFLLQGRNIRLVDQYPNFIVASSSDGDTVNTALFGDNIHPNEAGYQLMGNTWSAAIVNDPVTAPTAPSGLTATAVSASQINLTWTDNSTNEGAFLIERSSDNVTFTLLGYAGADVTNYVDTGLSANTTYYYRVRARNTIGDSPYSNVASAMTFNTSVVAAPTGLTATPGNAKVNLKWNAVTGATSYNVKRSTTNGGPYVTIASPSTTNYTDFGLVNGTTYYYVVSSLGSGEEGTNPTQASATPNGIPVAHYRFENNTLDSSGNNNHAVPTGVFTYGAGKVGANSATFDGSTFAALTKVVQTNFTVAAWVKTTGAGVLPVVDAESPGTSADWGTLISGGKFGMFVGAPDTFLYSSVNVNDGSWHHVAATRRSDTGEVRLYVDGVFNTNKFLPVGPRTAPIDFHIGANHTPASLAHFTGSMDDVRLYDEGLVAVDIAALANPPPPVIQSLEIAGGSVVLHGTGGNPNAQYLVLSSTNLTLPVMQWTSSAPNDFDGGGKFSSTNATTVNAPVEFFRLRLY